MTMGVVYLGGGATENSGPADQGRCLVITGTASLRSVLSGNVPGTIRA